MTSSKQNKDSLGKGIRSLLQSIDSDLKTTTGTLKNDVVEAATNILRIPVEQIQPNQKIRAAILMKLLCRSLHLH